VGLFPERTVAADLLAEITATVARLPEYATSQVSSHASIQTSFRARRTARLGVKTQMEAIVQIACALKMQDFSIPRRAKEEELINTGRSFVERAEPLKTEFIQHGLPPVFIENLKTSIQALEESLLSRANGQAARSGAIREFNKLLDHALNLVERFEAIIDNTMADDELVMAAWKVASQIDRLPQTTKREPEPALATQTATPAGKEAATANA
jgi:hypothetical protein